MRKFLLALALLFAAPLVTACETLGGIPTSPGQVAQLTKADEQAAVAFNLGYKAFRLAAETGVESGLIKGTLAGKVREVDSKLFAVVTTLDAAYRTANADAFHTALTEGNRLLAEANALVARKGN